MSSGFSRVLSRGKKKPWPTLPLTIGAYIVKEFREVEGDGEEMKSYRFGALEYRTYDLERIVFEHCKRAKVKWNYQHTQHPGEDERRNWYNADRKLAPGADSGQEDPNDQTLEERSRELGGASSSLANKPRTIRGQSTSIQQREMEAKAQQEREKKMKEDEEKCKKSSKAEQKKKQVEGAKKEKEKKEAEAVAEQELKKELDKVEAEQATATERNRKAELQAATEEELKKMK